MGLGFNLQRTCAGRATVDGIGVCALELLSKKAYIDYCELYHIGLVPYKLGGK